MVRPSRNASNAQRAHAQAGARVTYPLKARLRNEADVTRVDIFDDVGDYGYSGISAKDFAARLAGVKGALSVHVSSAGGDVFDGITIYNAIRDHRGPVTVVVDGLAASIASVIVQGGQTRVVAPGGMVMIHDAWGVCVGSQAEMESMAAVLDKVSANIAGIYAGAAGGTAAYWRSKMRAETWYDAAEAVSAGLADRVGDRPAVLPDTVDLAALGRIPGSIAARLRDMPRPAPAPGLSASQLVQFRDGLREGMRAAGLLGDE